MDEATLHPKENLAEGVETLDSRLDALWVDYLTFLDQYVLARDELNRAMVSGFFSLAQANRSPVHGRRYGQDWYDGRMKASRRCQVIDHAERHTDGAMQRPSLDLQLVDLSSTEQNTSDSAKSEHLPKATEEGKTHEPGQQPSPPPTPTPTDSKAESQPTHGSEFKTDVGTDPLRWFGILVPPELRRAQSSFTAALTRPSKACPLSEHDEMEPYSLRSGALVRAANAIRCMKVIEAEIRRLRKSVKKADRAVSTGQPSGAAE